jgi:transcriptional regulator with XRE-family HTH domain
MRTEEMKNMEYSDTRIKAEFKDRLRIAMDKKNLKAVDLCRLTETPKSTMSQYLSGKREAKADKIFILAKSLDVSEAWLLGYDVPMERTELQKKNDRLVQLVGRMRRDDEFAKVVEMLDDLQPQQFNSFKPLLSTLVNN